jgi:hypothetical protein
MPPTLTDIRLPCLARPRPDKQPETRLICENKTGCTNHLACSRRGIDVELLVQPLACKLVGDEDLHEKLVILAGNCRLRNVGIERRWFSDRLEQSWSFDGRFGVRSPSQALATCWLGPRQSRPLSPHSRGKRAWKRGPDFGAVLGKYWCLAPVACVGSQMSHFRSGHHPMRSQLLASRHTMQTDLQRG